MAQHQRGKHAGVGGSKGSGPSHARIGAESAAQWGRDSSRYTKRGGLGNVRMGDMEPGSMLPERPGVRPWHVGVVVAAALLVLCAAGLAVFVFMANSQPAETRSRETSGLQAVEAAEGAAAASAASAGAASAASATASASAAAQNAGVGGVVSQVERLPFDLEPSILLTTPGSDSVISVAIDSGVMVAGASGADLTAVIDSVHRVQEFGECGFVFVDAVTGRGLAYNADRAVYIASASKAVLAFYALLNGAGFDDYTRSSIEESILYSDNLAYEGFGYSYASEDYGAWLAAHDVSHVDYIYDLYPPMSARSLAAFWAEILRYEQTGSEESQWFSGLLGSTDTSFIRDGLDGTGAVVVNKAGWIGEEGYASVTDAGIIDADGHVYIMAIVTGQFDDDVTEEDVAALARALFDVRANL